ncbi:hypothetical protein ANI_1_426054 [Paecilomyces variotii No. 5]|uniref:Uncharacterized protein n=1 Tax=Byssochlamys spectabilis (strain No. 5 / NBRC 109023) TaxID=1356009 RepID=V5FVV8_BYSSN|nr:hypothetical protein ANI_1_426054 [Paecilomyces variotii No. 5]
MAFDDLGKRSEALNRMTTQVKNTGSVSFTSDELSKMRINVKMVQFSGTRKETTLDPCYFDPYPLDHLGYPDPEMVEDLRYPNYKPDEDRSPLDRARPLSYYLINYLQEYEGQKRDTTAFRDEGWRCVPDDRWRFIWEYEPSQWYVNLVCSHADVKAGKSHLKSVLISNVDGDDGYLFRGEILSLLKMINGRKITGCERQPVLLFSGMGPQHLRLIQAHWDGQELVIQKSKLYDLRHKDDKLLDFLAAWFSSRPVGDLSLR